VLESETVLVVLGERRDMELLRVMMRSEAPASRRR